MLTTTSEQRPPFNNGRFESSKTSLNFIFIRHLFQMTTFSGPQGGLYTQTCANSEQQPPVNIDQHYPQDTQMNTVKPVYNNRPWDPKIVAIVDKWPLFRDGLYYKIWNWAFKIMAFVGRWPLFRGGRWLRFDCTNFIGGTSE